MGVLVDTNVFLRRPQTSHPLNRVAVESVARLIEAGERVCVTPQIVAEFWCVATRPAASNGLGLDSLQPAAEVQNIEAVLELLPDTPAIYPVWKKLVGDQDVKGVQVHDARLAASMRVHGLGRILTFNGSDFRRFAVDIVHPADLWSP